MSVTKNIETMLKEDGFCITGFSGRSMLPMLREGKDRVLLVSPKFPLPPDTVALFRRGEDYVLHRVIGREGEQYIFRGDYCATKERVKEENILGVMEGFFRAADYHDAGDEYSLRFARYAKESWWRRRLRAIIKK